MCDLLLWRTLSTRCDWSVEVRQSAHQWGWGCITISWISMAWSAASERKKEREEEEGKKGKQTEKERENKKNLMMTASLGQRISHCVHVCVCVCNGCHASIVFFSPHPSSSFSLLVHSPLSLSLACPLPFLHSIPVCNISAQLLLAHVFFYYCY